MPPGESSDVISIIGPAILALAVLFAFIIIWRLVSLGRLMIANGMRGSMKVRASRSGLFFSLDSQPPSEELGGQGNQAA